MDILIIIGLLVLGTGLLSYGSNLFVASASHIAKRFGVPSIVIGLTVVAFGTSAPEFAVNILASIQGNSGIALGNVVGSNSFNVALILGVCSLIMPLTVNMQLLRIDIPIMIVSSFIIWLMTRDLQISQLEGSFLVAGLVFYTWLQIRLAMKERQRIKQEYDQEISDKGKPLKDGLLLIAGLGLLVWGADLFVHGAVKGARLLGWSESLIGLTIIAAGTSLPEVATSVAATMKGERDIAIGNVVGSNIFNILGVLGLSSTIIPLPVEDHMANVDVLVMLFIAALTFPLTIRKQKLGRIGGAIFVLIWCVYTGYLVINSGSL